MAAIGIMVDDHVLVREGLTAVLNRQQDLCVVAEAANGEEALAAFRLYRPDVTLMDIRMPVMDGAEATEAILAEFPHAVILVVTTIDHGQGVARALKAGAKNFILKDAPSKELIETIRSAHAMAA